MSHSVVCVKRNFSQLINAEFSHWLIDQCRVLTLSRLRKAPEPLLLLRYEHKCVHLILKGLLCWLPVCFLRGGEVISNHRSVGRLHFGLIDWRIGVSPLSRLHLYYSHFKMDANNHVLLVKDVHLIKVLAMWFILAFVSSKSINRFTCCTVFGACSQQLIDSCTSLASPDDGMLPNIMIFFGVLRRNSIGPL